MEKIRPFILTVVNITGNRRGTPPPPTRISPNLGGGQWRSQWQGALRRKVFWQLPWGVPGVKIKINLSVNKHCVLSWCCSDVLGCTWLNSFVIHFNISPNVQCFPILIWQKWNKICINQFFCVLLNFVVLSCLYSRLIWMPIHTCM